MADDERQMAWHLTPEPWFRAQPDDAGYLPEAFATDGFVHLTHGAAEVIAAGNRYYQSDPRPNLALQIDLDRITSEIRYDDPRRLFPHVYGPLDREAIREARAVERDQSGRFLRII
jgi:uncharacterized protein (DUF952 family)